MIKQLLIGLPETGKTTFLAALWAVVDSEEVPNSLKLEGLDGDRTYLNKIRGDWECCNQMGRTLPGSEEIVSMKLIDELSGQVIEIHFPDLSGELFRDQWEQRRWTKAYADLVSEATGVLLFIHPNQVKESLSIDLANDLINSLEEQSNSTIEEPEEPTDWMPALASTQVKLIDLLQFITQTIETKSSFRVAVIISAWDLVCGQGKSSASWLEATLPLLDQFLKANSEIFETRVYGISAIGGELDKDVCQLREKLKATERIIVEGLECGLNDITAPVRWLMG